MIVIDASVLAPALADDGDDGDIARREIATEPLVAPYLIDVEVASVVRRAFLRGDLVDRRAWQALTDLRDLPLRRLPHAPLLERIWELRDAVSAYDAAYVALAEALDAPLVTADARLGRAAATTCQVVLVTRSSS